MWVTVTKQELHPFEVGLDGIRVHEADVADGVETLRHVAQAMEDWLLREEH